MPVTTVKNKSPLTFNQAQAYIDKQFRKGDYISIRKEIGPRGMQYLAEKIKSSSKSIMVEFKEVNIDKEGFRLVVEAIKSTRTVEWFGTTNCGLDVESISLVADILRDNNDIIIGFDSENIGEEGIKLIVDAMKDRGNPLNVNITNDDLGDNGGFILARALQVSQTTKSLSLEECRMGIEGFKQLCNAIKGNSVIEDLNILVPEGGMKYIADALYNHPSLTWLQLKGNFGKKEIIELAKALSQNSTLKQLDLSGCQVDDEGVGYLSEALKGNDSLEYLWLSDNKIKATGAKHLSELVEANKTLRTLYLRSNEIGVTGATFILKSLQKNSSLRDLNIGANGIDKDSFGKWTLDFQTKMIVYTAPQMNEDLADLIRILIAQNSTLEELGLTSGRAQEKIDKGFIGNSLSSALKEKNIQKMITVVRKLQELYPNIDDDPSNVPERDFELYQQCITCLRVVYNANLMTQHVRLRAGAVINEPNTSTPYAPSLFSYLPREMKAKIASHTVDCGNLTEEELFSAAYKSLDHWDDSSIKEPFLFFGSRDSDKSKAALEHESPSAKKQVGPL